MRVAGLRVLAAVLVGTGLAACGGGRVCSQQVAGEGCGTALPADASELAHLRAEAFDVTVPRAEEAGPVATGRVEARPPGSRVPPRAYLRLEVKEGLLLLRVRCTSSELGGCVLSLFDALGTVVRTVQPWEGRSSTNVVFRLSRRDTYYLGISGTSAGATGAFSYQLVNEGEDAEGDTLEDAELVTLGMPHAGTLEGWEDRDFLAFAAQPGGAYQVECTSVGYRLWTFRLEVPGDVGATQAHLTELGARVRTTAAGYVSFSLEGHETLEVQRGHPFSCTVFGGVDDAPDLLTEPARPLPLGVWLTGVTEMDNDEDVFAVQAPGRRHLRASCVETRSSLPCDVQLYGPSGSQLSARWLEEDKGWGWTKEGEAPSLLRTRSSMRGTYTVHVADVGPDDRPGSIQAAAAAPVAGSAAFTVVPEVRWDGDVVAVDVPTGWTYRVTCSRATAALGAEMLTFLDTSGFRTGSVQLQNGMLVGLATPQAGTQRLYVALSAGEHGIGAVECQGQLL